MVPDLAARIDTVIEVGVLLFSLFTTIPYHQHPPHTFMLHGSPQDRPVNPSLPKKKHAGKLGLVLLVHSVFMSSLVNGPSSRMNGMSSPADATMTPNSNLDVPPSSCEQATHNLQKKKYTPRPIPRVQQYIAFKREAPQKNAHYFVPVTFLSPERRQLRLTGIWTRLAGCSSSIVCWSFFRVGVSR